MPSKLGRLIKNKREGRGLGLREFARLIKKSPAFVVMIENDDEVPSVSEDSLRAISRTLDIASDKLMALAQKLPADLTPKSDLDLALYRKVRKLSREEKKRLIKDL